MKREDKDLLLQDLCARLAYGVKVHFKFEPDRGEMFESYGILESINNYIQVEIDSDKLCGQLLSLEYNEIKPYLFPLSSMTKEQKEEYNSECNKELKVLADSVANRTYTKTRIAIPLYYAIDWLNKNHFDYRGLIEKGLALDATGLNIYNEEKK